MRRKYIPVAFLALTVALAGCTQLSGGGEQPDRTFTFTQNDGLSISFSAANAEFFQDGKYTFTATVTNTGQAEATVKRMQLFGASWASGSKSPGWKLSPVEKANELPGEQRSATFRDDIQTNIPQGQSDTYNVGLRTTYSYTSRTRSKITVMTRERFRDAGTPQKMTNDIKGAPIQIRFDGTTPLPSRGGTVSVPVKVTNVGDGQLKNQRIKSITVKKEGGTGTECTRSGFRLFEGSRTFTCTVSVPALTGNNPVPEKTLTLIAKANYDYVEDDTTTVTIIGTSGQ
ncbi:MAG: hypothetical protein ABEI07_00710 [Candidatus Nanohaloarchaea archaeon]